MLRTLERMSGNWWGAAVLLKRQRTIKSTIILRCVSSSVEPATVLTLIRTLLGPLTRHNQSMSPVTQQQHLSHVRSYARTIKNWGQWKGVSTTPCKSSSWGSVASVFLPRPPFLHFHHRKEHSSWRWIQHPPCETGTHLSIPFCLSWSSR